LTARVLSLQAVRGIAANLVVLQHLWEFELKYANTHLPLVIRFGDLGVDIFFVLSGFVMVAIAGRGVGPLQFLWRRAARIYPTYWLATVIMLIVAISVPGLVHEQIDKIPLWRSFLLIAASPEQPVVSVGWTLVYEVYFYFVFGVFLALRVPILIGALAWTTVIISTSMALPDYVTVSPILRVATSPRTFEFMMGLVIGTLWLRGRTPGALLAGIAGLVVLIATMTVQYRLLSQPPSLFGDAIFLRVIMFAIPISLILYALVAYERRSSRRPPTLLIAIGDWSYSIYLFHFMMLSMLGRAVFQLFGGQGKVGSIVLFVGGFLLVNLAGAILYYLFERPTLKWLHRLGPSVPATTSDFQPLTSKPIRAGS
jgi:exopolysaccharide production protein ExoZ